MHLFAGELTTASSLVDEILAATEATGSNLTPYGAVGLAALRGREPEAVSLIDEAGRRRRGEVRESGSPCSTGLRRCCTTASAATSRRERRHFGATEHPHNLSTSNWGMGESIRLRSEPEHPELATAARSRLAEMAKVSGTDWALGVAARSEALFVEDQRAEDLYAEAVDRLGRSRMAVDLARAHLLYGEWLRRQRRRIDARGQLRTAHDLFSDFGMEAFAERARVELEATGEHVRKRTVDSLAQLTPQETQISRLVAQGNTNREIAAQLFISPSTVEYHLRKVFRKLGVKSRTQLASRVRG